MEIKLSCLFVLLVVGFGTAAPAAEISPTDEVEFVPLGGKRPQSIPNFPGLGSFPGLSGDDGDDPYSFLASMQEMMTRLRQQMSVLLGKVPGAGEGGIGGFPGISFAPSFGSVDLGKGNTTSVTKVIDGHKVVINETTYEDTNANGGSFFKVRIIDVKPDGENTEKPSAAPPSEDREVEALEDSLENEISKTREYRKSLQKESLEDFDYNEAPWDDLDAVESIEDNGIADKRGPIYDLSGDTYVNKLKEQAGAPFNPDAEFIDFVPNEEFAPNARYNDFGPEYNGYAPTYNFVPKYNDFASKEFDDLPYDLSRDTDVNKLMEAKGAPHNPDAEFIDEIEHAVLAKNMRLAKF